jgi:hypothetical protein
MLNKIKETLNLNEVQWTGFRIGAIAGLALFLVYGAPNALIYGGYGAILLAGKIFGAPVEPAILARVVIAVGMLVGLLSSALLFVVLSSLFGAGIGSIGNLVKAKAIEMKQAAGTVNKPSPKVSETASLTSEKVKIEKSQVRPWTKAGAIVGAGLFFIFGLIPGALYGGATGILLANRIFSLGEPSSYMVKTLYAVGAVMGALGAITVFLVIGAIAGTLAGFAFNSGRNRLASGGRMPSEMGKVGVKSKKGYLLDSTSHNM